LPAYPPKINEGEHDMSDWHVTEMGRTSIPGLVRFVWNHLDREECDFAVEAVQDWLMDSSHLRIAGCAASSTVKQVPNPLGLASGDQPYVAGAYLQEYPGRIAALVGPAYSPRSSDLHIPSAEVLVRRLVEKGGEWNVELIQSILDFETPFDRRALSLGGLKHLTNLYQMHCSIEPNASSHDTPTNRNALASRYQFRDYRDLSESSWIRWLEETYHETSDCPELNGLRSTCYALEGYKANSKITPLPWFGVCEAGDANRKIVAGFMLSQTDATVWELAYLGVIPEFRQRGLGRALLAKAIEVVGNFGGKRLWLAVDQRNSDAIKLYREQNFSIQRTLEAWFTAISKNLN
jgi:mycothiol synthase